MFAAALGIAGVHQYFMQTLALTCLVTGEGWLLWSYHS